MRNFYERPFDIVFLNGQSITATPAEIIRVFAHRYAILLYLAVIVIAMLLRPYANALTLPSSRLILLYIAIYLLLFSSYLAWLIAGCLLAALRGRHRVHSSLVMVVVSAVATGTGANLTVLFGGDRITEQEWFVQWSMNLALFELISISFFLILVPIILEELRMQQGAEERTVDPVTGPDDRRQPSAAASLTLLPEVELLPIEILRAEAQLNYVLVVTAHQRKLVRMSFQRFLDLMPEGFGLRVHRSHWVATTAIRSWDHSHRRSCVTLSDGSQVPVSRSFQLEEGLQSPN